MMTTIAEVVEAERLCREQRQKNARLLEIDEATPDLTAKDLESCRRIKALVTSDFAKFEAALQHPGVGQLFARGALYFRRPG